MSISERPPPPPPRDVRGNPIIFPEPSASWGTVVGLAIGWENPKWRWWRFWQPRYLSDFISMENPRKLMKGDTLGISDIKISIDR